MRYAILACALLAGCDTPPFKLVYRVASGSAQTCVPPSQSPAVPAKCSDVDMECEAVLNVRVLRPSEPNAPYIGICEMVPHTDARDLCSIGKIDLPTDKELPRETHEVQVMVWPRYAIAEDPVTHELDCRRHDVKFSAIDGFPIEQAPAPAFGGRAFWHPGDDKVVVTLGCTDSDSINVRSCVGAIAVDVIATVDDFDTQLTVGEVVADRLTVAIGEPSQGPSGYVLGAADKRDLGRPGTGASPVWNAAVQFKFDNTMCLEILEDGALAATARCTALGAMTPLKPLGVRLSRPSLEGILEAVGLDDKVPPQGITIGVVVDDIMPAAGYAVTPSGPGTIQYLSADRSSVVSNGTATTASGVFVSQNAPYGTVFQASMAGTTRTAFGGLIEGKITIVVLQVAQTAQ